MTEGPARGKAAARPREAGSSPVHPGDETAEPRRWIALAIVLTAAFMALLDISIVNVAIPSIQTNLGASFADVQWVIAGYALSYSVVLVTGGRLGDIFGRKRVFMLGMAGFTVASALCGFAVNPGMLVASRLLQGLMAALMYPQVLSVIQVSFPPRERPAAFGVFGAVIGLATILGPLTGGLIIRDDLAGQAWRFVFLVNLPVGIISLVAAWRLLRESRAPDAPRLDLAGVAVVTAALLLVVVPLVEGRDAGWPAWAYACLAVSPVAFAAFIAVERRLTERRASPLVPLTLFSSRSFTVGLMVSILFLSGVPSFFFTFSLYLQIGLQYSALHAGLTTIPFSVGTAIGSIASVRLAPRVGKSILVAGTGLTSLGVAACILTIHARGSALDGPELIPALTVAGLGLGATIAPLVNVVLSGVPWQQAGAASGVLTTVQQVGAAVGVAIIGVIYFGLIGGRAAGNADAVTPDLRAHLATLQPAPVVDGEIATFRRCFIARANGSDPAQTPSGCPAPPSRSAGLPGQAIGAAARDALGNDFGQSLERSLIYNVGAFAMSGVLVLLLPRARPRQGSAPQAAPAEA